MLRSKNVRNVAISLAIVFIGIQLVPVDNSNPSSEIKFEAPDDVMAILRTTCFDCHSNETAWPWYGHVAPVSWWLSKHVNEGRLELNFSTRDEISSRLRQKIWSEVRKGNMPTRNYTFMHPDSRLTDLQKEILSDWSQSESVTPGVPSE